MKGQSARSLDVVRAFLKEIADLNSPDQDNTAFVVLIARAEQKDDEVMDLDAMPVLAHAGDTSIPPPKPSPVTAPQAKPVPDESKAYYYRGQKYYRD